MSKNDNHIADQSKLTRFRTFEEMKSAPFAFPSKKPLAERLAEQKKAFDQLRSTSSVNGRRIKKTNKKTLK